MRGAPAEQQSTPDTTTPATRRALSVNQLSAEQSAVKGAGRNARDVGAIEADVGQFAIAELRQLVDVALIIPERLDHADEREQHGSLLSIGDSAFGGEASSLK